MNDIVYFELNNWSCGKDYPDEEPFISWMGDDLKLIFRNEEWVKENKLCVVLSRVDLSTNFCVTAPRKWVEQNCPSLLTIFTQFLRKQDEDGYVYGRFGTEFLPYEEENIGVSWVEDEDWDEWWCEEDDDDDEDDSED